MTGNILLLTASARKESVSAELASALLGGANGMKIKAYNAFKLAAKPCCGCGNCEREKKCINRDLDEFFADFEAADYFVIATPVFNSGVPAPLKAIVDRFQLYYALRFAHGLRPPVARPKKAALLIAAGSKGEGRKEIEAMFLRQFTVLNTTLEAVVFADSTDSAALSKEKIAEAKVAGRVLFN